MSDKERAQSLNQWLENFSKEERVSILEFEFERIREEERRGICKWLRQHQERLIDQACAPNDDCRGSCEHAADELEALPLDTFTN